MKRYIVVVFSILYLFSVCNFNPKYVELNNLLIVDKIDVVCEKDSYLVTIREVIPIRDDNGIEYEHKNYQREGTDLSKMIKEIENETRKKVYLKKAKVTSKNCQEKIKIK